MRAGVVASSLAALSLAAPRASRADGDADADDAIDRSAFWLFAPTPREWMRPLSTGDTPYTVDAGHVLVEIHPLDVAWALAGDGSSSRTTELGQTIVKLGLADRVDVQLAFAAYHEVLTDDGDGSAVQVDGGSSDTSLRVRVNLWGDGGGDTALAVMPFVSAPTGESRGAGAAWGGVLVPVQVAAPYGLGVTVVVGGYAVPDDGGELVPAGTMVTTVSGTLAGPVGFFVEGSVRGQLGADDGADFETHDGFTVSVGDDGEIDLGCHVGLPDPSGAVNPYVNVAWRH